MKSTDGIIRKQVNFGIDADLVESIRLLAYIRQQTIGEVIEKAVKEYYAEDLERVTKLRSNI